MQNRNMNIGYSYHAENKHISIVFIKNSFGKYIVSIQNKKDSRFKDYEFSHKNEGEKFFKQLKELNQL